MTLDQSQLPPEDLQRVLPKLVSLTAEEVSCERPAVALHDERADEIVIFFTPDSAGKKVRPAESVVLRRIFETGVGAAVNDVGAGPQADSPVDRTLSARQLVAAPLDVSGSRVGLVAAVNSTLGGFTHDDVRRLTMVADWAALAIENGRLKSAMARQQQELETLSEADKTKSDFVSVLAHELKGPMTAVKGFAEVLQDRWEGLPQATVMRTLRIMSKEIERLSRLVGDLLDLSQIEDGTLGYEMRPLSLGDLIDDIVTGHPSLTEKHRLEIVVPDNLPKVLGDEDRVGQVLLNLLSNANRHSQPGTTITIGARLTSEEGRRAVEVCVADQGIGISAQDRSRLFSKFAMLPKPEWIAKGTGLGLYISKGIIEAHGGRLWVDSEPDQGSTFCFSLTPAADGP